MKEKISLAAARRIALAAQGFADPRPEGPITRRHLNRVLDRTRPVPDRFGQRGGARALHAALFAARPLPDVPARRCRGRRASACCSNIGRMRPRCCRSNLSADALAHGARRQATKACMAGWRRWARDRKQPDRGRSTARSSRAGPIAASDIEGPKGAGGWWGWSDAKAAFEWLFWAGRVTTHSRRGFERLYDLPERVLPAGGARHAGTRAGRGASRAAAHLGPRARRRDLRRPARLFPPLARRHEGPDRGTGRGRRAAAGQRRGLAAAGLSPRRRAPAAQGARRARCLRPSIRWSSSARAPNGCSTSATASRSTRRPKSASSAITSCPSCSATRSWRASICKADRPAGVLRVVAAYAEPGAPPETAAETAATNCRLMQAWLGLGTARDSCRPAILDRRWPTSRRRNRALTATRPQA